jgi:hypothetical protein
MILKNRGLSNNFLLFIAVVISSVEISCARVGQKPYPNEDRPIYTSQMNIVKQGYMVVPSPYGPIASIYFGYKRKRDLRPHGHPNNNQGIDIIEYKMLKKDGGWNWQPYLVLSDDNFDGIVDRLFLDSNLDGALDKIRDIALEGLKINSVTFKTFNPWQGKPPGELPANSPNLI